MIASEPAARARRTPTLTPAGMWLLATGVTWSIAGVLFTLPAVTALGCIPILSLIWGYAVARSAGAALRAHPWQPQLGSPAEPRVPLGRSLEVSVTRGDLTELGLLDVELEPVVSVGLAARLEGAPVEGETLILTPHRIGDAWLQGFHLQAEVAIGLFRVDLWQSCRLRLTAVPPHVGMTGSTSLAATRSALQDQSGGSNTRRRGFGMEIRELRDHVPGDPFKHIAWRATARRGKLIAREFESELVLSAWIAIDVSPSMFWGAPGKARIDFAVETAYNLLEQLVLRGDRAGLLIHDEKVRLAVEPGVGRRHLLRLLDGLLEVPHLVHEGRTEVGDRELVARVARWWELHEQISFALPEELIARHDPRDSGYDELRLVEACRERLEAELLNRRSRRPPAPTDGYAHDLDRSLLRAFCRHLGVGLPLDPTPMPGAQSTGVESALQHILRAGRGPHAIVMISDFYTADDRDTLRRVALASRRRRHSLIVCCPADVGPSVDVSPRDRLMYAVSQAAILRTEQNIAAAQAVLRPAGVTFLRCGAQDIAPRLLQRLRQVA